MRVTAINSVCLPSIEHDLYLHPEHKKPGCKKPENHAPPLTALEFGMRCRPCPCARIKPYYERLCLSHTLGIPIRKRDDASTIILSNIVYN